jgi:hypothetical protein
MPGRQREISSRLKAAFFMDRDMNVHKSIAQVFENNMGNRITPELAAGMIRSLIDILAAGVQPGPDGEQSQEQGSGNGVV